MLYSTYIGFFCLIFFLGGVSKKKTGLIRTSKLQLIFFISHLVPQFNGESLTSKKSVQFCFKFTLYFLIKLKGVIVYLVHTCIWCDIFLVHANSWYRLMYFHLILISDSLSELLCSNICLDQAITRTKTCIRCLTLKDKAPEKKLSASTVELTGHIGPKSKFVFKLS